MSTESVEPSSPDESPAAAPSSASPPPTLPLAPAPSPPAPPGAPGTARDAVSPWAAPGSSAWSATEHPAEPGHPADAEHAGDVLGNEGPAAGVRVPRCRPRTGVLVACGLVLGTLLGGGLGYGIQAKRPPTPLPPLQVALPRYPAAAQGAEAAAAAAPKPLTVDGDLRKLVMNRPDGSEAWGDYPDSPSWLTLGDLAELSGESKRVFASLNSQGFRRAAGVDWKKNGVKYRVTLVQFSADNANSAIARVKDTPGYGSQPFADGVNGSYHVETTASHWAESTEQFFYGFATARRGTAVMEIEVFAPQQVDAGELKDLAKRQWERMA